MYWTSPHFVLVDLAMAIVICIELFAIAGRIIDRYSLDLRLRVAFFKQTIAELKLNRRIAESNDNLLRHPRWTAFGHIGFAFGTAAIIGTLTTLINDQLGKHANTLLWHLGTSGGPILITASLCVLWHTKGAPWLKNLARTGYILHTFHNPGEVPLNLPAPETSLIVATTVGITTALALNDERPLFMYLVTAFLAGITAAAMTFAKPNDGGIVARGIEWQTEDRYLNTLMRRKQRVGYEVVEKQRRKCAKCKAPLWVPKYGLRLTIKNLGAVPPGPLETEHIEAVCRRCAATIPSTV